jgi:beta-glucosidase
MGRLFALLAAGVFLAGCDTPQKVAFREVATKTHSAVTPCYHSHHPGRTELLNERIKQGKVDLIFIGDSITHGWENNGKEIWEEYYAQRNAVNLGTGWDQTQHVLWRLEQGNIDGISPKAAVLMIGTNNVHSNTAEEIADGIIAICARLRKELPRTKILLLAIFPYGAGPSPGREKNARASEIASQIADGKMIYFLDINDNFLTEDDMLIQELMPDLLHPSPQGYQVWAQAMEPKLAELLGEE